MKIRQTWTVEWEYPDDDLNDDGTIKGSENWRPRRDGPTFKVTGPGDPVMLQDHIHGATVFYTNSVKARITHRELTKEVVVE